ncbi:MAG: hypothetical protein JWO63_1594 [Frankiales bacterium]|nr:hypothetical protein [Frankiales bacterium]
MASLLLAPTATLAALGLAAVLASHGLAWRLVGVLLLVLALLGLGVSAGLRRSVALEVAADAAAQAEAELDEAILAVAGSGCGEACESCGVDDCAVKSLPRS